MHYDENTSSKVQGMIADELSVGNTKGLGNSLCIVSWECDCRGTFKNGKKHPCTLVGTTISYIAILHCNKIHYQISMVTIDDCNIPTCDNDGAVGYISNHSDWFLIVLSRYQHHDGCVAVGIVDVHDVSSCVWWLVKI